MVGSDTRDRESVKQEMRHQMKQNNMPPPPHTHTALMELAISHYGMVFVI